MAETIDVSGMWGYLLDPENTLTLETVASSTDCAQIRLPGSLDEHGVGQPYVSPSILDGLARKVCYTGSAWFVRRAALPADWMGQRLKLTFERVHWFSDVWVNGVHLGSNDSLSTPHRYEFVADSSEIQIVVRIDNTIKIPIGKIGHAVTDWTQTNWNGAIGQLALSRTCDDLSSLRLECRGAMLRVSGFVAGEGRLEISVGPRSAAAEVKPNQEVNLEMDLADLVPWSDRDPCMHKVHLRFNGQERTESIGFRAFEAKHKQFYLNGMPVFLRGTLECCVFPLTAYPPTSQGEWQTLFAKVKEFGLNHVRFHSWCPPTAAFEAADTVGVLLQVELPVWTGLWPVSSDASLLDFCRREAHRILQEYGHHPSFVLFGLGNEIAFYGLEPEIDSLLSELKETYLSQLFNFSAHGTYLSSECDYYVQADNGKPGELNKPLRGSTWFGVGSRFDREPPSSTSTVQEAADQFDRPVISHEVGEWAVFPDVHHADRYTGVLSAKNFEAISEMLTARGLGELAPQFVAASGKLSAQLYKEEIETLLRTRGLAGYQLLGLSDFPGQGTATIGMLDAFWNEKGFVSGHEFHQFCADTVPLLKLPKVVWRPGELMVADVAVHHSGPAIALATRWGLSDADGTELLAGDLQTTELTGGGLNSVGSIRLQVPPCEVGQRLTFTLRTGPSAMNTWHIWVLPDSTEMPDLSGVDVFEFYREDVRNALMEGRSVWLRLHPSRLWGGHPGRFAPAFWSPVHFKEQVGTMGTLIEDHHPLFDGFPTKGYTEWVWWDILTRSKALSINALPKEFRPTVQIIDRYERNDKLATIFEAQVGKGRILVTAIDFTDLQDRPAAECLKRSIETYLSGSSFRPAQLVSMDELDRVFYREP